MKDDVEVHWTTRDWEENFVVKTLFSWYDTISAYYKI
jgi:hypothetical protein